MNWRDSTHPQAGGAELYCESVARRMAEKGARVTLLTSRPRGARRTETIQGVEIRRYGGTFGVYPLALLWLLLNASHIDQVVDCQNGIPFFTPLAVKHRIPIVCLIFHVHQEQFNTYFRWPLNRLGQWLEGPASRAVYGRRPVVVISPSTRAEVRQTLRLKGKIFVVPCGMDAPSTERRAHRRSPAPRIACVGRLVPHKQMGLLVAALPEVLTAHPTLTIDIAGTGPELAGLQREVQRLGLSDAVRFHGRVSDADRDRLLTEAWLTVNPSVGEGWGLSVIEANACGIPAIAFRVPGLQDAIVNGETGWLVEPTASLAPAISSVLTLLHIPSESATYANRVLGWARRFDWDQTTRRLEAVLDDEEGRLRRDASPHTDRTTSDLACRVDLPATATLLTALAGGARQTDIWTVEGDHVSGLLHGTDEAGAGLALARLGVGSAALVRPARPADWLLGGTPVQSAHA